jgi:hypothetical protein
VANLGALGGREKQGKRRSRRKKQEGEARKRNPS